MKLSLPNAAFTPLIVAAVLHVGNATADPKAKMPNPDFTKDEPILEDAIHDWNLGASGWMLRKFRKSDSAGPKRLQLETTKNERKAPPHHISGNESDLPNPTHLSVFLFQIDPESEV